MAATDFCGCCGNPCVGTFCFRCRALGHLGPSYLLAWDRTYFAMNGVACPFQTGAGVLVKDGDT